jgi:hypothetical protein
MHTRIVGSTRQRRAVLSVLAFALWALPASAHAAAKTPADCSITSAAGATAALTIVRGQLAITKAGLSGASAASPAVWRLHEETDQLDAEYHVLDQLHTAFAAKEGATPGSPAQWRAQESTGSLCEQLEDYVGWRTHVPLVVGVGSS